MLNSLAYLSLFISCIYLAPLGYANNPLAGENFSWKSGATVAVSLSYDDALDSQLDNVVPVLNKHGFKASFYLTLASPIVNTRLDEWRLLASQGHELGNHTLYHPCKASLPGRNWVKDYHDMDKRSVEHMIEEILLANSFLHAIDGKTERTFTPPCNDLLANGTNYLPFVKDHFVAIKGQGVADGFSVVWAPANVSARELIAYVKSATQQNTKLINIIFHSVGGDHLSVSQKAHNDLLTFLAKNRKTYWVDTYLEIAKYAIHRQATPPKQTEVIN